MTEPVSSDIPSPHHELEATRVYMVLCFRTYPPFARVAPPNSGSKDSLLISFIPFLWSQDGTSGSFLFPLSAAISGTSHSLNRILGRSFCLQSWFQWGTNDRSICKVPCDSTPEGAGPPVLRCMSGCFVDALVWFYGDLSLSMFLVPFIVTLGLASMPSRKSIS